MKAGINPLDLASVAKATECYCRAVIDAVVDSAAIIKPQAAFFEQLGPHGMVALHALVAYCRQCGLDVLLDGKRGDIGTTAEGYADAYLGRQSPWSCDALTVNPYLGDDTLEPFVKTANQRGAGVFVLVKTSNPGSGFLQDLELDGQRIYHRVSQVVQRHAAGSAGQSGYGNIGAVVGATYPEQLGEMREAMPNAWLLIPGYGAQGGTAKDVAVGFDPNGLGAIVNSSRGIIFAYLLPKYQHLPWQEAIAQASRDMASELPQPA
jgi:orotidine-5'-phosphate decarboxylase